MSSPRPQSGLNPLDPAEGLPSPKPPASFVPLRNKFLATPLYRYTRDLSVSFSSGVLRPRDSLTGLCPWTPTGGLPFPPNSVTFRPHLPLCTVATLNMLWKWVGTNFQLRSSFSFQIPAFVCCFIGLTSISNTYRPIMQSSDEEEHR